jgi:predicted patatin/cPLA2 family phospholipase
MKREWRKFLTVALGTQLAVTGCATPHRLPAVPVAQMSQTSQALGPIRFLVSRETQSSFAEAASLLVKEQQWRASQGQSPELPTAYFLAVSGGGDNGAYGAGFLKGWTATGSRPEFKVVTGVSTGALIAPFAFLGPRYDYVLERVYTTSAQKDIFKKRGILKGLFGDGMADTRPLAQTIQTYVNRQLLDAIAAEYAKGRLLLVGTANLDTMEPVIWNMTAIAARKDPDAIALFSKILLASASIPGAFPPVMIDVTLDGHHYQEMHVDGGTTTQLFLYPPSLSLKNAPERKRVAYILRNARLDADWQNTERRTMTIAMRAIDSLTRTQGIGDLYRIYATTQRDGVGYNLTYIPPSFNVAHKEMFDTAYMKALFEVGRRAAQSGPIWQTTPPGFDSPVQALTTTK